MNPHFGITVDAETGSNQNGRTRSLCSNRTCFRIDPSEWVYSTCWCEATFVKIRATDVGRGYTKSCGVGCCRTIGSVEGSEVARLAKRAARNASIEAALVTMKAKKAAADLAADAWAERDRQEREASIAARVAAMRIPFPADRNPTLDEWWGATLRESIDPQVVSR